MSGQVVEGRGRRPVTGSGTPPSVDERQAWIALAGVTGVGDMTFFRLLEAFGSARAALLGVARLSPSLADSILARRMAMRLRRGLAAAIRQVADDPSMATRRLEDLGAWALTPLDEDYPARLHELVEPPAVVYGLGDRGALIGPRIVSVVGTRRPTGIGRDLAGRIAARLTEAGVTVVSGLAIGIDAAAHLAVLDASGTTVAVVAGGLDAPGPAVHRALARSIARHGAVISEHAPGVSPTQGTFPRRNRIISAVATATIVVEAPARSGALITARHALEQGRALLVAPGRPLDPRVAGNLMLLRESPARPLVGLDEMLVDLGLDQGSDRADADAGADASGTASDGLSASGALALLGPAERAVAAALVDRPCTVDGLVSVTGLSPGVVAGALTLLQLRGWARVHGAMQLAAGPLLRPDGRRAA